MYTKLGYVFTVHYVEIESDHSVLLGRRTQNKSLYCIVKRLNPGTYDFDSTACFRFYACIIGTVYWHKNVAKYLAPTALHITATMSHVCLLAPRGQLYIGTGAQGHVPR